MLDTPFGVLDITLPWTVKQVAVPPTPRMGHVFLEFEDKMLVIGGYQSAPDQPRSVWSPRQTLHPQP